MFSKIKKTNIHTKLKKIELSKEEQAEKEMEALLMNDDIEEDENVEVDVNNESDEEMELDLNPSLTVEPTETIEKEIKENTPDKAELFRELCDKPLMVPDEPEPVKAVTPHNVQRSSKTSHPSVKDKGPTTPTRRRTAYSKDEFTFDVCEKCQKLKSKLCSCTESATEEVVKAFIYDLHEDRFSSPGTVFLFAKAVINNEKTKRKGVTARYQNICIEVSGLKATILLLPKENKTEKEIQDGIIFFLQKIFKSKPKPSDFQQEKVRKQFCFEHQMEEPNIISNGNYNLIQLTFLAKLIKPGLKSAPEVECFRKVFNFQQSLTENFILNTKLKGPSWMHISKPIEKQSNLSWCPTMLSLKSIDQVKTPNVEAVFDDPPLTVMSLSVKTVVNETKHYNEILSISCCVIKDTSIDKKLGTKNVKREHFTILRDVASFNMDSSKTEMDVIRNSTGKGKIYLQQDEKSLLSLFLNKLQQVDPDVLISHGLLTFDIPVILNRMHSLKVPNWSRLFRLRLTKFPSTKYNKGKLIGRLGIDTEHSAKELVMGQKNYSFDHLVKNLLSVIAFQFFSGTKMVKAIRNKNKPMLDLLKLNLEEETELTLKLCDAMGVLLLTKNVTNLCGNLWNRTLSAGRSERIEYLLLHEFHRRQIIFPEKYSKLTKKGKQKYAGGLVLDPQKGLYDKSLILLLDFNSLYPSIIQEYNLCFTNTKDDNSSTKKSILPSVLHMLVSRRNEVKRLIKNQKQANKDFEVLDIRQKALKIIANSMYGCLGFSGSRFYTQHIAEKVTKKGRELLGTAVEIVENKFGLDVIYGDTDSIMIKTNFSNKVFLPDGKLDSTIMKKISALSREIRKKVSGNYSVVELGEDGMFLSLLLLKKKKYAALSLVNNSAKKEVKGLDMVRRDWCFMTKKVSNRILDILLNRNDILPKTKKGESEEDLYDVEEKIMTSLLCLKEEIENDHKVIVTLKDIKDKRKILSKYLITKGLNKAITDYDTGANKKSTLPHVQVAKRLQKNGKRVKVGDHIAYFHAIKRSILQEENTTPEKCVLHPDEFYNFKSKEFEYNIDTRFYIEQQLLPPIERLLIVVDEVNLKQVYETFGIKKKTIYSGQTDGFALDGNELDKKLMFNQCQKFVYTCNNVACVDTFALERDIAECVKCKTVVNRVQAHRLLVLETKKIINQYYQNTVTLKENQKYETNCVSVFGDKISFDNGPSKSYDVKRKLTEQDLLLQLKYFASILGEDDNGKFTNRFVKRHQFNYISTDVFQLAFGKLQVK